MNKKKSVPMSEAIDIYLFEQEPEGQEEEPEEQETNQQTSDVAQKDKDRETKELDDIEKDDLDYDDEFEDGDVAISVKLNDNVQKGGEIKLVSFQRLSTINKIEDLLKLFNIDQNKVADAFENQLELTIQSPLSDFENEKYIVRLMDGSGEISIQRDDFNKTISKSGTGGANLGTATQQQLGGEEEQERQIDLTYLPALNFEFKEAVGDEFFSRILAKS